MKPESMRVAFEELSPTEDFFDYRGLFCLRISFWQEGEIWFRIRFPAEPTETLADRFFTEAKPAGNPSITHPLGFEAENSLVSLMVFLAPGRNACGSSFRAR